jgi:hypothetical protein
MAVWRPSPGHDGAPSHSLEAAARRFRAPVALPVRAVGALYVVDWGEIHIAPERGGVRMPLGTGALWRIRRMGRAATARPSR